MVITYDTNPSKNTVFRVMTSYMGDHPIKAVGNLGKDDRDPGNLQSELPLWPLNPLSFTVPKGLPKGKAVVAWTWFNHKGNREMYMQCATVIIGGEETSMRAFEALPGMFKANIGGGCVVPTEITAIDFKHPGPEVFGKGITPVPCGEPSIVGSGGSSGSAPAGSGNYGQNGNDNDRPSVGVSVTTPTKTGNSSPPLPPKSTEFTSGDNGVLTTYLTVTPSPTAAPSINVPSAPTTLTTSAIPYTAPQNTGTGAATVEACTNEGVITCGENRTWYMCGSGRKQFMGSLAAGTTCTAGKIAKRGIRGYYF